MNLKDKIKTAALALTTAFTLGGCTDKKPDSHQTEDMLSAKFMDTKDMYNNPVRLEKKFTLTVYKDKEMTQKGYSQLVWGFESDPKISRKRAGEKTHGEEYVLPDGFSGFVEVYDDNVLKENNSLIVINQTIQVVGDSINYERNLKRYATDLQAEAEKLQKIRKLEQIRAQEREEARRRALAKTQTIEADSAQIANPTDSVAPKDTTQNKQENKIDSLHGKTSAKHIDTIRHYKTKEYE